MHARDDALTFFNFGLASVLASYPEETFAPDVRALLDAGAAAGTAARARLDTMLASPAALRDLRARYLDLFDRGGERASLHETEHGRMRGMSKGTDLADIAGFYQAFGVAIADAAQARELPDHLAVELEFYRVLLAKQVHLDDAGDREGSEIVKDARKKFLADHLGRLADAVGRLAVVREDALYGELLGFCAGVVAEERKALDVEIVPLDLRDRVIEDDSSCGSGLPILQS